jgi:hypothetical protein
MTDPGHSQAAPSCRRRLPNRRAHELLSFEHDGIGYTAGLGRFDDGRLAEIFLNVSVKTGTALDVSARDSAVVASLCLQYGAPVETIRRALISNANGTAAGALGTLLDLLAKDGGER